MARLLRTLAIISEDWVQVSEPIWQDTAISNSSSVGFVASSDLCRLLHTRGTQAHTQEEHHIQHKIIF